MVDRRSDVLCFTSGTPNNFGSLKPSAGVIYTTHLSDVTPFFIIARVIDVIYRSGANQKCIKTASVKVAKEVCEVWGHHFGLRLVYGKDSVTQKISDSSVKLIVENVKISEKINKLYRQWKNLECESKRLRKKHNGFKAKVTAFEIVCDTPLNILK